MAAGHLFKNCESPRHSDVQQMRDFVSVFHGEQRQEVE